jgi:hypothetical protein
MSNSYRTDKRNESPSSILNESNPKIIIKDSVKKAVMTSNITSEA